MDWWKVAIGLVPVAVWIISNLVKNQQEQARRNAVRKPVNPDELEAAREAPRENPFLEEIRRRKEQLERQTPPVRRKPSQEKQRRSERVREPETARSSRRPPPIPRQAPEPILAAESVIVLPAAAPVHIAPFVTFRRTSAAIENLHALMKHKQTLATAFLLTEVLGKPRCKRK